MTDVVIKRLGNFSTVRGESDDGKLWLINNTGKDGEVVVSLTIQTELVQDFQASLEADGLSVEVK